MLIENAYQSFRKQSHYCNRMSFMAVIVSTDVPIENWLNNILEQMYYTHRLVTKGAIYDYGKNGDKTRIEWIHSNLGMVCLVAGSVWFTACVEETFQQISNGRKDAMQEFLNQQNALINDLMAKGLKIN